MTRRHKFVVVAVVVGAAVAAGALGNPDGDGGDRRYLCSTDTDGVVEHIVGFDPESCVEVTP